MTNDELLGLLRAPDLLTDTATLATTLDALTAAAYALTHKHVPPTEEEDEHNTILLDTLIALLAFDGATRRAATPRGVSSGKMLASACLTTQHFARRTIDEAVMSLLGM